MELYSMPMFNKFLVNDIDKSSEWYQENLGFKSIFKFKNEQNQILMEHLRLYKYTCTKYSNFKTTNIFSIYRGRS